jgi:NAD(P)-dependent dehydrogenase (short-subunit alcohol dehydrogenase family)
MAERVAVVTGAASGIGLATVLELLEDGENAVVGIDLADRPDELDGNERVDWVSGDVSSQDTWDAALAKSLERDPLGAEWLLPCAGIQVVRPFGDTTPADYERMFAVNVLGVVRGMQTLIPKMLERGHGAIAVVCSITSETVVEGLSAYATSKAAVLQTVRSAALEYAARGLQINAVCPGFIDTPLLNSHLSTLDDPAAARAGAERRTPLGRILAPEQVASALCFLVSDKASGMSGASVMVDGGLLTTFDFDSSAHSA